MSTQWRRRGKVIAALALVLVVFVVIAQNTQAVTIRFLFFTITMPSAVLIGLALLIGVAAGLLVALTISGKRARSGE
jgi:lipopolysaccharide assembly protein A